jgi:hypothetical protein
MPMRSLWVEYAEFLQELESTADNMAISFEDQQETKTSYERTDWFSSIARKADSGIY